MAKRRGVEAAVIRSATTADVDKVLALADRLRVGVAPWREEAAVTTAVRGWVRAPLATVAEPGHAVLVAELDDVVVGFVTLSPGAHWAGDPDASIGELVVSAEAEGRGVGRALVEAALERARDNGCTRVSVSTGAANERARSLYRRLGFEDVTSSRALR
jgi:ribosomal protein S18 acetylase RimI-like enzyme